MPPKRQAAKAKKDIDRSNLDSIFSPKSIAVIGASRSKKTIGNVTLHNIIENQFQGPVYPINPKADYIHSIFSYNAITEIPHQVDLAIIIVPKEHVIGVARQCAKKKVKAIAVISSGFREVGKEGIKREFELLEIVRKSGIRLVGPNCMGIINMDPEIRMNATFAPSTPNEGRVALASQSGALGVIILEYAKSLNIGFSKFISMGNKADVSSNDFLEYTENDPYTEMALLYLESFGNPRRFTSIARRYTKKKPIIAVKAGSTVAGAKAASSHTGAMAGADVAVDALFDQCGVIRATSIEELFDYVQAFSNQPLPKGKRVAIMSNAGGPGIITTDAAVNMGLEVANFEPKTVAALKKVLPEDTQAHNPIDMLAEGGAEMYRKVLGIVLKDKNVDSAIVIFVPPLITDPKDVAIAISDVTAGCKKPVLGCFMSTLRLLGDLSALAKNRIPVYMFPESAVKALYAMYQHSLWVNKKDGEEKKFKVDRAKAKRILDAAVKEGQFQLTQPQAFSVLSAYGFPFPESGLAESATKAAEIADGIGYPVVLKIQSEDIVHKSDVGGVAVDVRSGKEVRETFKRMVDSAKASGSKVEGVLVQEMVKGGKETILGMKLDPTFGPLVMIGTGGIYVEVLKDFSIRIAPITDRDAREMVESLKGYPLLEGVRGEASVDIQKLNDYLQRLSRLVEDHHCIEEIDINPFVAFKKGKEFKALDARIILATRNG